MPDACKFSSSTFKFVYSKRVKIRNEKTLLIARDVKTRVSSNKHGKP